VIVKNTFLGCSLTSTPNQQRSQSVPASARLCKHSDINKALDEFARARRELQARDNEICRLQAELEQARLQRASYGQRADHNASNFRSRASTDDTAMYTADTAVPSTTSDKIWCDVNISSNASEACANMASLTSLPSVSKECTAKPVKGPTKQQYMQQFEDIIQFTVQAAQCSGLAGHVELTSDEDGWSIVLEPLICADDCQAERLLTIAKEALSEASSQSRCIYLIGYNSPKPVIMQPQGFMATLGAMENPKSACWHMLKKGFCRHGDECNKKHPVVEVPVQVLLERGQFNSSSTRSVRDFKRHVADLAMSVLATLKRSPLTESVEASKEKRHQGWKLEVVLKESMMTHKDHVLSLAKDALLNVTSTSKHVYILGDQAKPFVSKSLGFVTWLVDMQDEKKACWSLYTKGCCKRDSACRWEHPTCLVPFNIIVKGGGCSNRTQGVVSGPSVFVRPR